MTTWPRDELERIGAVEEIGLASRRPDGSLRPQVTMWVVRAGDNLYVRSAYGPGSLWYRHAIASGTGRIRQAASNGTSLSPRPPRKSRTRSMRLTTPHTAATDRRLRHRPRCSARDRPPRPPFIGYPRTLNALAAINEVAPTSKEGR